MSADTKEWAQQIRAGNRRILAKAISLVEGSLESQRHESDLLLQQLGARPDYICVGISGPPGVGKSSFIEALGLELLQTLPSLAVLTIDPSSPIHGGSLLGDKTRMTHLSMHPKAFIRPSPSSGALGGMAARTREVVDLLAHAGFPLILIETVGVGQSEVAAAELADLFVGLFNPNTGDDLQAIKKGIMEVIDLAVVTKADGVTAPSAQLAATVLQSSWHLLSMHSQEIPPIYTCSSVTGAGIKEIAHHLLTLTTSATFKETLTARRQTQAGQSIKDAIIDLCRRSLNSTSPISETVTNLSIQVQAGTLTRHQAAQMVFKQFYMIK